jgi:hypothetical protein
VESVDDKVNRTLLHISSLIHRLRQAMRAGFVRSEWTPKEKVLADILTRCMHALSFLPFRDSLVIAAPDAVTGARSGFIQYGHCVLLPLDRQ